MDDLDRQMQQARENYARSVRGLMWSLIGLAFAGVLLALGYGIQLLVQFHILH